MKPGQRVVYVAGRDTAGLVGIEGLDAAVTAGQVQLTSVTARYTDGEPVDAESQVAAFAQAAEEALADGWSGLRVAADVTSLVLSARQRSAWVRYEHLADDLMARKPLAGLCGFQRTALTSAALAEVTCVHPSLNAECSQFRLYSTDAGAHEALAGEVDRGDEQLLAAVLRAQQAPEGDRLVIDATGLSFIDHHGLGQLARYAADVGVTVVLRAAEPSAASTIAKLVPMAGLDTFCDQGLVGDGGDRPVPVR